MNRLATTVAVSALTAFAFAEETLLGTKADLVPPSTPNPNPTPVVSGMDMVQLAVALGLVFVLLKVALPKLVAKFGKRLSTPLNSSIEIEESAHFGGGNLQVVKVRGKTLLLAVAPTGVTCLADLTDATPQNQEPAFFELLDQAKEQDPAPTHAVVEMPQTAAPQKPAAKKPNPKVKAYTAPDRPKTIDNNDEENLDLQERLRRLSRLVN